MFIDIKQIQAIQISYNKKQNRFAYFLPTFQQHLLYMSLTLHLLLAYKMRSPLIFTILISWNLRLTRFFHNSKSKFQQKKLYLHLKWLLVHYILHVLWENIIKVQKVRNIAAIFYQYRKVWNQVLQLDHQSEIASFKK